MGKKILLSVTFISLIIFVLWGTLTINLITTNSFNSLDNERYTVNYEDVKEKIGIDLESFSKDNAYIKSYNSKDGLVIVVGEYFFNFNSNVVTKTLANGFNFITETVNNINQSIYDIFY